MSARKVRPSRPITGRFQDEAYVHWLKAGQALLVTAKALNSFCETPLKHYHQILCAKYSRQPCNGPCGAIPCGSCTAWRNCWRNDIRSHLTPRHDRRIPCWANADEARWETDYWEVAKCFMAGGKEASCTEPADTDPIGLLQLIFNCDLFDPFITPDRQAVRSVRTIRNQLYHSADFKMTKRDLDVCIDTMVRLLKDPVHLINDIAAQEAVQSLNEILSTDVDESIIAKEHRQWKMKLDGLRGQQSTKKQVYKLFKFVRSHDGLMRCFGDDISRLKTQVEKLDKVNKRIKTLEGEVQAINRLSDPEQSTSNVNGFRSGHVIYLVLTIGVLLFAATLRRKDIENIVISVTIFCLTLLAGLWYLQFTYPKDKPSSPSNLEVVDVSTDSICVKWQAPESDGNSPITRYIVEKADGNKRTFKTVGRTNCDTLKFNVSGLDKSKKCFVRVSAENAIGLSQPICFSYACGKAEPSKTSLEWTPYNRLNKEHTKKLRELHDLWREQSERIVPELHQIYLCAEEKFMIGEGNKQTLVYVGFTPYGREVAVKRVIKLLYKSVDREVKTLVKLRNHQNVVAYMELEHDANYTYIATELCDFTIEQWIERTDLPNKDWNREAAHFVRGILRGLHYMHTLKPKYILHKDLKPANIFVVLSGNEDLIVKIADFGVSQALEQGVSAIDTTGLGTMQWMPGEVLKQVYDHKKSFQYHKQGDIQSAGMVCFYVISRGIHPYKDDDDDYMTQPNIVKGKTNLSAVEDSVARDLVTQMLAHEPCDRPSAKTLLRHPYLWDNKTKFEFLAAVGGLKEVKDSHDYPDHSMVQAIEATKLNVLPQLPSGRTETADKPPRWDGDLEIQSTMPTPREAHAETDNTSRPSETSVCKLLGNIHNPRQFKEFGDCPYAYFSQNYPQLFMEIYNLMKSDAEWTKRSNLKFYEDH